MRSRTRPVTPSPQVREAAKAERNLHSLARAVERSRGFSILIARCESDDQRRDLTERLRRILASHDLGVTEVNLADTTDTPLSLLEAACTDPEHQLLSAHGLEKLAPEHLQRVLTGMNHQRELYRDRLGCPLLLWLYADTFSQLARQAPDLFDWRSGLYEFPVHHFPHAQAAEAMRQSMTGGQAGTIPAPEAKRRLAGMRDLLTDLENAKETPENTLALSQVASRIFSLMEDAYQWREAIALAQRMVQRAKMQRLDRLQASWESMLGLAYYSLPTGDRAANLQQVIACYEAALRVYTEAESPTEWAATQNNLGNAYGDLPTGDRAANLQQAIACYQAALRVYTEADFPTDWATTRNNLAVTYSNLPTGDRTANLQQAIACYEAALRVYTETDFPTDWAMTQNNLGTAYGDLPTGDRSANLRQAIACLQAALRIYTEADFPVNWAAAQHNLGLAYQELPTGDRAANLQKAIACYQAALRVRTEFDFPTQWAMTQNNLGNAYRKLPTGDRATNLQQAITCFEAALRVRREADFPMQWALTTFNVALLCQDEALPGDRCGNLLRAQSLLQDCLRVFTPEGFPHDYENVQVELLSVAEAMREANCPDAP